MNLNTKLHVAAALLPLASAAYAAPSVLVVRASIVTAAYVAEIQKPPTGKAVAVQDSYWTGRRILRRDEGCIEEQQKLVALRVVTTDMGSVQVPDIERIETPVACPAEH